MTGAVQIYSCTLGGAREKTGISNIEKTSEKIYKSVRKQAALASWRAALTLVLGASHVATALVYHREVGVQSAAGRRSLLL